MSNENVTIVWAETHHIQRTSESKASSWWGNYLGMSKLFSIVFIVFNVTTSVSAQENRSVQLLGAYFPQIYEEDTTTIFLSIRKEGDYYEFGFISTSAIAMDYCVIYTCGGDAMFIELSEHGTYPITEGIGIALEQWAILPKEKIKMLSHIGVKGFLLFKHEGINQSKTKTLYSMNSINVESCNLILKELQRIGD